jgi:hypothetical protein
MKAMGGQAYFRISWRKLISVVGALLLIGAPMSASFCAKGNCLGQSSSADARCSGMAMPQSANSIDAQSSLHCCQMKQELPATLRQSIDTVKAKGEFSSAALETALPSVLATRKIITRPLNSSPHHDVQSLSCTLLI